jgi:putative FmdB family regulatory protein
VALEEDQEEVMPVYEFECDTCGFVIEKFYRAIPRVDPTQVRGACRNCGETDGTFKKIFSKNTFHLKGGKCEWGAGRYSSAAPTGATPVSIDEDP